MLLCLRHYFMEPAAASSLQNLVADIEPVLAARDDVGGLDIVSILSPLEGRAEVSYYAACYLLSALLRLGKAKWIFWMPLSPGPAFKSLRT